MIPNALLQVMLSSDLSDLQTRMELADVLEELGRMPEVELLRGGQPVLVIGGQVEDRQQALLDRSEGADRAVYVSQTDEQGRPSVLTDWYGHNYPVRAHDSTGALAAEQPEAVLPGLPFRALAIEGTPLYTLQSPDPGESIGGVYAGERRWVDNPDDV